MDVNGATRTARPGDWFAAAAGLALMAVLGFAGLGAIAELRSSAAAVDVLAEEQERFARVILALSAIALLDVVVAWALWRVFRPERPGAAALAAAFRLAYAAVFVGAIAHLDVALRLAAGTDDPSFGQGARALLVDQQVQVFDAAWNGGLILFAAHLVVLGWLLLRRTGAFATVIGVLVAVAGLGYAADSVLRVLVPVPDLGVAAFTFVGEVLLIGWLIAGGVRAARSGGIRPRPSDDRPVPALARTSEGA